MATASLNPRYVFTRDRIPAVVVYSIATAVAAILGLLAHEMFGRSGWFINAKDYASGFSLFFIIDNGMYHSVCPQRHVAGFHGPWKGGGVGTKISAKRTTCLALIPRLAFAPSLLKMDFFWLR